MDYGIFYPTDDKIGLHTFVDSDKAGDIDSRRSTLGVLYKFWSLPISWSSKLQSNTTLFYTKAQYCVLSKALSNITYFWRLLKELKMDDKGPTPLLCDNMSSIWLVRNPVMHQRTKHIELNHHYLCNKQQDGTINVSYVPTYNQHTDLFTKALGPANFIYKENAGLKKILA